MTHSLARRFTTTLTALMVCAACNFASAREASEWKSLITANELKSRVKNPKLLIIDVRSAAEYAAGHIPGAINLPGAVAHTGHAVAFEGRHGPTNLPQA